MKLKNSLLFVFILAFCTAGFAQNSFSWEKVRYGGRFSFEFSNETTSIIVAPVAIYPLNKKLSLGASVSLGYAKFKDPEAKLYNYGISVLTYYNPIGQVELSAELEQSFVNQRSTISDAKINYNFLAFYLGAGYRTRNVTLGMRYDVLYKKEEGLYASPFAPFVRVYF
ncbi:hypothetical protein [Flavicella sediminum]|uniref:hypothetical protein n=1 Tax=Flavicella sediminum TaxID=2585141 RepID=UPI0011238BE6|nr:hypothetical protein [Flavicella sediminum]